MNINVKDSYGNISISKEAIAQITQHAITESYGFVGLGYKNRGIVELLKGENMSKGVDIKENENGDIDVEIFVIAQYGVNIASVSNNAMEKIKYQIENMTSIKVNKIIVNVQAVRVK